MKNYRILQIHNFYQIPGGEDVVVRNEKRLLEEHGHKVYTYYRSNSELAKKGIVGKLFLPFTAVFSLKTYREVKKLIRENQIDIVHVHNTLTMVSPSVFYAAFRCKVPVVQTLHNFRMLCPAGSFFRDNVICEECVQHGMGCAIRHKCYRNSKLQSFVSAAILQIHRFVGTYRRVNFICLTEFNRKKLLESAKTNDAARIQKKIKKIQKDLEAKQKELDDLKAETILVIRGVSALDKELLGTLVAEARETLETLEKQLVQAQEEYEEATKTAKRSNYICNELFTWADVYDTANHDERRAILQQFITEIRVRKDYEISITLNASFNQVEQLKAVSSYDGAEIFEGISEKEA